MRVAVCISTYKRPKKLAMLLESLSKLRFVKVCRPSVLVVVVDNDAAGSAGQAVETSRQTLNVPILYVTEPRRGVASARNRAVEVAGDVDFIAFVDDDEVVSPYWLDELLFVQKQYDADVVAGPVMPRFETTPPKWVVSGRFFEKHGPFPSTCNVLVRRAVLDQVKPPFDTRFNYTGGSDTFLFRQLSMRGARMAWADGAVVEEWIPEARACVSWLMRRAFRYGITTAICDRLLLRSAKAIFVRIAKGAGHIVVGTILLVASLMSGRARMVRALQRTAFGVGNLLGLMGYVYNEYLADRA